MGVYKRGKNWWIRYSWQGREIRESTKTTSKRQAEEALAARKADIARGIFKFTDTRPSPLFLDFARQYLSYAKVQKRSWKRDECSLRLFCKVFGSRRLDEIAAFDVERHKLDRKKQVVSATINRELALLKHLFNKAIEWGAVDANPVTKVKMFREDNMRERFLTPEEEDTLLRACLPGLRPVVLTALTTGMRLGEILRLRWEDVDLEGRRITVRMSKNDEQRMIPIAPTLLEALRELRRESDGEWVFTKSDGQPRRNVYNVFKKACRQVGLHDLRFHDLRHTFASNLVMTGADIVTVKNLLGHKTLRVTMRYAHVSDDHMRDAVHALDARRNRTNIAQWPQSAVG